MEYLVKLTPTKTGTKVEKIPADHVPQLQQFYDLIGCRCVEVHRVAFRFGWNVYKALFVMDEESLLQENIPLENDIASILFSHFTFSQQHILGTVVIANVEGEEIVSLDEATTDKLVDDLMTFPMAE